MPKKKQAGDVTTIGLVQMNCVPEPEKNLKKAIAGINESQLSMRIIDEHYLRREISREAALRRDGVVSRLPAVGAAP